MTDRLTTDVSIRWDENAARVAEARFRDFFARIGRLSGAGADMLTTNPVSGGKRSFGQNFFAYMDRAIMGRGGAPGALGRLGAGMLGFGGGVNSLPSMATAAVGIARQQEQAYSNLQRRVGDVGASYDSFRESVISTGRELGYTREQILKLTDSYVSAVGKMSQGAMNANLTTSMNLAKTLGIDPSIIVNAQGTLGRTGLTMGGGSTAQQVNGAIFAAITNGGMKGREEEVVKAIDDLTTLMAERIPTVTVDMFNSMAGLMTTFNATGVQGLMGSAGAAKISGISNYIAGNNPLMALMIQNQRAKSGQGQLGFTDLMFQMGEGAGNRDNLAALAGGFGAGGVFPGGKLGAIILGKMLGTSPQNALAMMQTGFQSGDFGGMAVTSMGQANGSPLLTDQDKFTKALTDFENSLTDLATKMLPVVSGALNGFTNIVNVASGAMGLFVAMLALNPFGGASGVANFAVDAFAGTSLASSLFRAKQAMSAGKAVSSAAEADSLAEAMLATDGGAGLAGGAAAGGMSAATVALLAALGLGAGVAGSVGVDAIAHPGEESTAGMMAGLIGKVGLGDAWGLLTGNQSVFNKYRKQTLGRGATGVDPFSYGISGDAFGVYSSFQHGAHTGVDFGLPQGTGFGALRSGRVVSEMDDPTGLGGHMMTVDYGGGLTARYAHLSQYGLGVGDTFGPGALLAYSGGQVGAAGSGTGTTGPHLLMEAWQNGHLIDPMTLKGNISVTIQDSAGNTLATASGGLQKAPGNVITWVAGGKDT